MEKPTRETESDDIRAADEVKRRIESGEDELVPAEFANRIIAGESPTRVWREYRGLSIEDVAARVNLTIAQLEDIERGQPPSLEITARLAEALGLSPDDLT